MLRLWNRFVLMDNDRLTKKIFQWDLNICNNNWAADLKNILASIGKRDWFDLTGTSLLSINTAKECFFDFMINTWKADVISKPKLRTYIRFKSEFKTEEYLNLNISRHRRSLVSQVRLGILPLEIEVGRFRGIPADRRICKCCLINVPEDEFHFVCICPSYGEHRTELYRKHGFTDNISNDAKFITIMSTKFRFLAEYLDRAWSTRNIILYNC